MKRTRWIFLLLVVVAALLSAWLFPAWSPVGTRAAAEIRTNGPADANLIDAISAAVYLPLWEEDTPIYLPFTQNH
jgi:hypothetical protein